jgi:hypothetical protein
VKQPHVILNHARGWVHRYAFGKHGLKVRVVVTSHYTDFSHMPLDFAEKFKDVVPFARL